MDMADRLAQERRARLAAERLLEQKSRELFAANERLALHARSLSDQIVRQRHAVQSALSEAELLKGQNTRFLTDLERAHTAAVMAERRLWEAINTVTDGFALYDADRHLIAANRAYQAFFQPDPLPIGILYEDMLERIILSGLVAFGEESPDAWKARMLSHWEAESIAPSVVRLASGAWVKNSDRRTEDGGLVSLVQDITEQMRIWAAIEAMPDGFVLYDRDDRLLSCNHRYREMYPEAAHAMVPGARFEDILRAGLAKGMHADAIGREEEWLAERLAAHRQSDGVHEQTLSDGRWIRAYDHPTPDGGRVGLRVDITAEKEQNVALEAAREAAEAASRAKSAFLANMSHEIRTPMNGVVGMAELLGETNLTEEQRLFTETIRSSGEALLVIINDILDYSKIEAARLTLHAEPFDLERVIHEVTMLLQPKAQAKGLKLMVDFDMFLPTFYIGDVGRMRQILTNLVGNAVKFTEKGHVLTRVTGMEREGAYALHITVEDTGIGIAPENLEHVFGEFNQVESEKNRKFEGTGLGLAITRKLIEHMGGQVWVDSELGRGSVFGLSLTLPVAEDNTAPGVPSQFRRALIVDDEIMNRTILERQLTPCGIEVQLCRSGAEALVALEGGTEFDVLLIDQDMPEGDGLSLARKLREHGVSAPILLLSATPAALRKQGAEKVVNALVQTPVLRSRLYQHLRDVGPALDPAVLYAAVGPTHAPEGARAMRILAAEDNRTNQLVFRKMVQDFDIELQFANNGREAVALFQSFAPDLIFMDISMPEMDGREATAAIRALEVEKGGHVPICALTAHAMDGDAANILEVGMDRYLTKPLRRAAIAETIADYAPAEARPPMTAQPEAESA